MLREKELSRQLHRHNLPGFNVPGPGQYVSYDMGTGTIERRVEKAKAQQSPWAMDRMERSIGGNNLNMKHKTIIGDPGAYVSHDHEMSFRQSVRAMRRSASGRPCRSVRSGRNSNEVVVISVGLKWHDVSMYVMILHEWKWRARMCAT